MSKKNFGYTSISNIKRRLGTWDSRKPGQSPKEMKALLEGADNTLQGTKMKPESQGSIISSNKVVKAHTSYMDQKHYKSRTHSMDFDPIRKSATDAVKDKVKIGPVTSALQDPDFNYDDHFMREPKKQLKSVPHQKNEQRQGQRQKVGTFRTQGKQDLLEGKPRKTTVSAKAGAGMQMLKAQMRRFGAKQWWQSKTH